MVSSGRGRPAALPPIDHHRPEPLDADGLHVTHRNRHGDVITFDFTELPAPEPLQRSLAVLFAARCTPQIWGSHLSSESLWRHLIQFTQFMAEQPEPVCDLHDVTASLVRRWRNSVPLHAERPLSRILPLLHGDPRLQSGPVADELLRRRSGPKAVRESYSRDEFDQISRMARRSFRQALRRIELNAAHLQRWRGGECVTGSAEWIVGEALDLLADTGSMPCYSVRDTRTGTGRAHVLMKRYREPLGGMAPEHTWQRLFLSRMEAVSLSVLLMTEFGWNLSVINELAVPRSSPDPGLDGQPTYRVEIVKPRRDRSRYHETQNFTDVGASSAGRVITHALNATRFARAIVDRERPGTDRLIVWRAESVGGHAVVRADREQPVEPLHFGLTSDDASRWATAHGLNGSPFRRGRRTVVTVNHRQPRQHSDDTYARTYALVDRRVQQESIETIAAGAEDALDKARHTLLIARLHQDHRVGDRETATADCADPNSSPFTTSPGHGCTASFLLCLACPNAHIHPGHHPRLVHLHTALTNLRSVLVTAQWDHIWAEHHQRLEDLKSRLGPTTWGDALNRITANDREIVDHLLNGALDR